MPAAERRQCHGSGFAPVSVSKCWSAAALLQVRPAEQRYIPVPATRHCVLLAILSVCFCAAGLQPSRGGRLCKVLCCFCLVCFCISCLYVGYASAVCTSVLHQLFVHRFCISCLYIAYASAICTAFMHQLFVHRFCISCLYIAYASAVCTSVMHQLFIRRLYISCLYIGVQWL